jgi:hypothetical protein
VSACPSAAFPSACLSISISDEVTADDLKEEGLVGCSSWCSSRLCKTGRFLVGHGQLEKRGERRLYCMFSTSEFM